jgi:hypothetical protein
MASHYAKTIRTVFSLIFSIFIFVYFSTIREDPFPVPTFFLQWILKNVIPNKKKMDKSQKLRKGKIK